MGAGTFTAGIAAAAAGAGRCTLGAGKFAAEAVMATVGAAKVITGAAEVTVGAAKVAVGRVKVAAAVVEAMDTAGFMPTAAARIVGASWLVGMVAADKVTGVATDAAP